MFVSLAFSVFLSLFGYLAQCFSFGSVFIVSFVWFDSIKFVPFSDKTIYSDRVLFLSISNALMEFIAFRRLSVAIHHSHTMIILWCILSTPFPIESQYKCIEMNDRTRNHHHRHVVVVYCWQFFSLSLPFLLHLLIWIIVFYNNSRILFFPMTAYDTADRRSHLTVSSFCLCLTTTKKSPLK